MKEAEEFAIVVGKKIVSILSREESLLSSTKKDGPCGLIHY
jgi:hypothetical protein